MAHTGAMSTKTAQTMNLNHQSRLLFNHQIIISALATTLRLFLQKISKVYK